PRADDHEHLELPRMLEDPYVEVSLQAPPSLDYIPGPQEPEQAPPLPDYVPGPEHANDEIDDEDDDMDIEANKEEEHLAHADSVVISLPAADQAPSTEQSEPFETDESTDTPPPHPAYRMTARISIPAQVLVPAWSNSEVVRLLAMSSPPSSPLSSLLQAEAASTSHSPSLPPPFILSPTKSDAPSLWIPPPLPILAHTSSPPLQLSSTSRGEDRPKVTLPPQKRLDEAASTSPPSSQLSYASRREDRLEVTLPPRKRLGIALGPRGEDVQRILGASDRCD
nr:hypothetical protein [Tanacetum cinerariifolium]